MKEYDVIVIGSGSGAEIASSAVSSGLSVALIDRGPLGGTCLNVGCIPSKMLIYPADRIAEIKESKKLGIEAKIKSIDFSSIMVRMRKVVEQGQRHMRLGLKHIKDLDLYETLGHFVEDYTLEVGGERIRGKKIFIVSGARPSIPPIKGLDEIEYLTNENVLQLQKKPKSLVIIGGGYIAVEYGHFFAAMGTKVTMVGRGSMLLSAVEPELSELLTSKLKERMTIIFNTEVIEVRKKDRSITVVGEDKKRGEMTEFSAEKVLVAAGRTSNADILKVENTGVEVDEKGFIKVNEYLETSKENIWALGDAIGKEMFKHVANEEAALAWHNTIHEHKSKMDYRTVPSAVFTHPQIASVGMTEEEARKVHKIYVGRAGYSEVAKGEAMMEEDGFAKAIVDKNTMKILGFHIIGPHASILIQEVINAMANGQDVFALAKGMHIHPALPELVMAALANLKEA